MELVEVDPIGTEPAQGRFDGLDDVAAGATVTEVGAVGSLAVHPKLGGHHGLVPPASECLAQHGLAQARFAAVVVRHVEQRDPGLQGCGYDGVRAFLRLSGGVGPAKVVASEAYRGDGEA